MIKRKENQGVIEIKSQNTAYDKNLKTLLADYAKVKEVEAILLDLPQSQIDAFFETNPERPTILLGTTHEDASAELTLPTTLTKLRDTINRVIDRANNRPSFENDTFSFSGPTRQLVNKKTAETIPLTEKETALMAYLYQHRADLVSKEQLLMYVWNYKPETETHTVETHVYALRQKLGADAPHLLQSSAEGYSLVLN